MVANDWSFHPGRTKGPQTSCFNRRDGQQVADFLEQNITPDCVVSAWKESTLDLVNHFVESITD
jgi:hypothetical protein